jgi:hypothetical protein
MKIILDKTLLIGFFLYTAIGYSQPCPTCPPEEPPGLPIDENIVGLLMTGILMGIFMIYRYNKRKASV